jgi:hypothetical protein
MTFEEHMQAFEEADRRIQQRHEALAQTVELLVSMHRDAERRQEDAERRYQEGFAELRTHAIQAMDAITRLANIAASHDARLDGLEDKH